MFVRISLRGMLRLIRVDTLRTVHNVGFLLERLIFQSLLYLYILLLIVHLTSRCYKYSFYQMTEFYFQLFIQVLV